MIAEKTAIKKTVKHPAKEPREKKPKTVRAAVKAAASLQGGEPRHGREVVKEQGKYFEAVGRRKTAIARVRIFEKSGSEFFINAKPLAQYLPDLEMQGIAKDALSKMNCIDQFSVSVKLKGGGLHAQAEAIRHGISRALLLFSPDFRKRLKKVGFLTRDPRMRERKKFGLKRARRAPQWAKR